ncbi:MAG: mannose-1-phosphate guanylyltransferase [Myxococcota bacterium]
MSERLFPVIIAGGSGTRFWPLSRKARPKQFLPLASDRPLIVETAARVEHISQRKDRFVVCGRAHAAAVKRLTKAVPAKNVLVEPVARNTAPAIGLATVHVAARDPQGVLAVLPADQHVRDVPSFQQALLRAAEAAKRGDIVTLGIRPTRAETGYGYIRRGVPVAAGVDRVQAFVEKPDAGTAQRYLASGEYLWNAGIFVFRADVMLAAFERHLPELAGGLSRIAAALGTRRYPKALAKEFPRLPSISIDYGVAEKAPNIAVVPGDFGWSDVGSFNALPDVRAADEAGNVVLGEGAIVLDSRSSVVLAGERPLAVVGMSDVVVVDAGDAVLVLPKEKSQDVRKVVAQLEQRGWKRYL